ncbi:MAG: sulfurtransferase TusA family protein [Theionarchaea archaeon]|nr:sulfurtransferase TusA family protein [Theionarchaea archaeon]MBU7037124.1 sulfurtransferase TusA family protein [Theionarchaea archaeon]
MESDVKLDSRGMVCPQPIVELAKQRRKMDSGKIIELWADDEGAKRDVPAWCEQTGNEFLGSEPDDTFVRYFARTV